MYFKIKNIRIFVASLAYFIVLNTADKAFASSNWDDVRFKNLDPDHKYVIASGTGFFVNSDSIITNRHVVEKCESIAIRGYNYEPAHANILAYDENEDLAALKADVPNRKYAILRDNLSELRVGDNIYSIGYPLGRAESGLYILKQANIIDIKNIEATEDAEIIFTDSVDHGNSGGPILDLGGNIVGVVRAKASFVRYDNTEFNASIGVSTKALMKFLESKNIPYTKRNTYDLVKNYSPDFDAKNYTVNIHCIRKK